MARKIGIVSAMAALVMALFALPASAACHVAAFSPSSYSVNEGAGSVTLTVVLQGGADHCSGSVDYATRAGTATAGQDFVPKSGTLNFTVGDDRQETITIEIINDTTPEGSERFTVELSNPQGGTITDVGDPASVTIQDNDEAPPPDPDPEPEPPAQEPEEEEQEAEESPEASPPPEADEEQEATPDDDGSPSPGGPLTFGDEGTNGEDDGGIPTAGVVGIVGLLIATAAGVGLWFLNKRKVSGEA